MITNKSENNSFISSRPQLPEPQMPQSEFQEELTLTVFKKEPSSKQIEKNLTASETFNFAPSLEKDYLPDGLQILFYMMRIVILFNFVVFLAMLLARKVLEKQLSP